MTLSMHSASAPIFVRMLGNMLVWLDKAEAHARSAGRDPNDYLALELAPDMLPFARQVQIASDHVKGCLARLAGDEPPKWADDEETLDELRARIRTAIDYARSVPAERVDGSEGRVIVLPRPNGEPLRLGGEVFLEHFSLPNFFFHCTMTYALLRQAGVPLGKLDYLGAP